MLDFTRYNALVISLAEVGEDGVGHSTLEADFPHVPGPGAPYDLIDINQVWGTDPATGDLLYVQATGVQRSIAVTVTDGVTGATVMVTPTPGTLPDACLVGASFSDCDLARFGVIDSVKHFILGLWTKDPEDSLPASLDQFAIDVPMPGARWTTLRSKLENRGVPAATIDTWLLVHPNPTPLNIAAFYAELIGL